MLSFKFGLAVGVAAIGINIWSNARQGKSFDWNLIVSGLGLAVFAAFLYVAMRLIFKLVYAKARHDEGRQ
ncbi:hypothetical protein DXH95_14840 [Sphingorhabdus pulchriflava]|uniref:Uncharacterized protein n=2 Tax=Sphingorhabdus pulchriflava TaxID=2292257 RepID=A0A371B294_9SPHN|nr:hypothetical protein DXH95_14840 [Sphingorhabdus pulchriflava]